MSSIHAYGSRFAGLILFILAIVLIGILVFLTVRSSSTDQGVIDNNAVSTTSSGSDFVLDSNEPSSQANEGDLTIVGSIEGESGGSQVAGEPTQTDIDADGLPNTGPTDILATAAGIGLLAAIATAYGQSKFKLASSLLGRKTS